MAAGKKHRFDSLTGLIGRNAGLIVAAAGLVAACSPSAGMADANGQTNQIGPANPAPAAPNPARPTDPYPSSGVILVTNQPVVLRSGPSPDAGEVARLAPGTRVFVGQLQGAWWAVRTEGGLAGYVQQAFLRLDGAIVVH